MIDARRITLVRRIARRAPHALGCIGSAGRRVRRSRCAAACRDRLRGPIAKHRVVLAATRDTDRRRGPPVWKVCVTSSGTDVSTLSPRLFAVVTGVVSTAALGFLFWLIYFHEPSQTSQAPSALPALNALLNSIAAALLVSGRLAIRSGRRSLHARLMLAALGASALFLVSYVLYHATHGDTRFAGTGAIRPIYFAILISHIALSAVVFPAILWALFLALTDRIERHRRVARWTWAGWMYVSVTGVGVFFMLHVIDWR
jgi:putative membrane protein